MKLNRQSKITKKEFYALLKKLKPWKFFFSLCSLVLLLNYSELKGQEFYWQKDLGFWVDSRTYPIKVKADLNGDLVIITSDLEVIKTDSSGSVIWKQNISNCLHDGNIEDFTFDSKNNILLTGNFMSYLCFDHGDTLNILGPDHDYGEAFFVKISTDGEFIWAKASRKPYEIPVDFSAGWHIITDCDDNIYAAGTFHWITTFDSIPLTGPLLPDYDEVPLAFLVKISPDGNFQWARSTDIISIPVGFSIIGEKINLFYTVDDSVYCSQYDPDGKLVSSRPLICSPMGYYIPYSYANTNFIGSTCADKTPNGPINFRVHLEKKTGDSVNYIVEIPYFLNVSNLFSEDGQTLYVFGMYFQTTPLIIDGKTLLQNSYFIMKIDSFGRMKWIVPYLNPEENPISLDVMTASNKMMIVAGRKSVNWFEFNSTYLGELALSDSLANEIPVVNANCVGKQTSVPKFEKSKNSHSVENVLINFYPNPVVSVFTVESYENIEKIRIINLMGSVVLEQLSNTSTTLIDAGALMDGMYLLEVEIRGKYFYYKFLKSSANL